MNHDLPDSTPETRTSVQVRVRMVASPSIKSVPQGLIGTTRLVRTDDGRFWLDGQLNYEVEWDDGRTSTWPGYWLRPVRRCDSYRIEADKAIRDYEALELDAAELLAVLRSIAEGRPNQPFDPWARQLAADTLNGLPERLASLNLPSLDPARSRSPQRRERA